MIADRVRNIASTFSAELKTILACLSQLFQLGLLTDSLSSFTLISDPFTSYSVTQRILLTLSSLVSIGSSSQEWRGEWQREGQRGKEKKEDVSKKNWNSTAFTVKGLSENNLSMGRGGESATKNCKSVVIVLPLTCSWYHDKKDLIASIPLLLMYLLLIPHLFVKLFHHISYGLTLCEEYPFWHPYKVH